MRQADMVGLHCLVPNLMVAVAYSDHTPLLVLAVDENHVNVSTFAMLLVQAFAAFETLHNWGPMYSGTCSCDCHLLE